VRTLAGSRLDLVERNNAIVLDYRKQELLKLALPGALQGAAGDSLTVNASVTSKYPVSRTEWNVASLLAAGGKITEQTSRTLRVVLPAWQASGVNQYAVSAVSYDTHGNASNTATSTITVLEPVAVLADGSVTVLKNNASADGRSTNEVQAKVTDDKGNPLSGQKVTFTATNGATVTTITGTTGADGLAKASLTSTITGNSIVTARLDNGQSASVTTVFVDAARIAAGDLTVTQNNAAANGVAQNRVQAKVTDGNSQPVAGQSVKFTATNGAVVTTVIGTTGADGLASASLTSTTAGNSVVTATLADGNSAIVTTVFVDAARIAAGDLTVTQNNAAANGVAQNRVQAKVTDGNSQPVAGQSVKFTATNGAVVTTAIGTTGADGLASASLTSITVGNSVVTATLANGTSATVSTAFTPLTGIALRNITVTRNNALSDGTDRDAVTMTVTDSDNVPVAGQTITLTATNGAVITPATVTTDSNGTASVNLTNLSAGNSVLTAALSNGSTATVTVNFITAAQIEADSLTVTANNAVADDSATNAVQLRVVNGNGVPVAGQTVTFTATNGATVTASATTGADGLAKATLTSTTAGNSAVTATLTSTGGTSTTTVTFIIAAQILAGDMTVVTNNAPADGTATNEVTAKVTNGNGTAVAGQIVTFTATNGATVTPLTGTTGADGIARARLTSTTAGDSVVTAALSNGSTATITVNFITAAQIEVNSLTVTTNNAAADGNATNAVQLRVVNGNGVPVTGQGVTFTATNSANITATATTGADGIARATLTSTKFGDSVVTATLTSTGETATVTATFTPFYAEFAGLRAGGQDFAVNSGFPTTGFGGAAFTLELPAGLSPADYTWSSSASWLTFTSVSGQEEVTMNGSGNSGDVTVTAMPNSGTGTAYRFTFSLNRWFIWNNDSDSSDSQDYNRNWCASRGYQTPSYQELTSAAPFRQDGPRVVGTLWGEWGSILSYNTNPATQSTIQYMADESNSTQQYSVRLLTGWVYDVAPTVSTIAICSKTL
jgi:adhesin/invasin